MSIWGRISEKIDAFKFKLFELKMKIISVFAAKSLSFNNLIVYNSKGKIRITILKYI